VAVDKEETDVAPKPESWLWALALGLFYLLLATIVLVVPVDARRPEHLIPFTGLAVGSAALTCFQSMIIGNVYRQAVLDAGDPPQFVRIARRTSPTPTGASGERDRAFLHSVTVRAVHWRALVIFGSYLIVTLGILVGFRIFAALSMLLLWTASALFFVAGYLYRQDVLDTGRRPWIPAMRVCSSTSDSDTGRRQDD
jgi:hypothetical protein